MPEVEEVSDPFAQLCTEFEMKQIVEDNAYLALAIQTFYNQLVNMQMERGDVMELTKFYISTLVYWEKSGIIPP